MKPDSVRTSIDLPTDLHRRLREMAARRGCSARQLILSSIEKTLEAQPPQRPARRLNLDEPVIPLAGRRINLTSDQIYDLIEFP